MTILTVQDLMTQEVRTIKPDDNMAMVRDIMNEANIRHLPVVDEDGNLEGIVSQRDLLRSALDTEGYLPASEQRDLLRNTKVAEVMVTNAETATPDQDIQEAGRVIFDNKLGCLPVVEGDQLVGILTEADFVKYVIDEVCE